MSDVPAAPALRCAPAAQRRGDQRYATAAPVTRWFLIEDPGPWGRDALRQSRLDGAVSAALAARARVEGVRVMMIRRPGRGAHAFHVPGRQWAYVDSRPGREASWWGRYVSDAELADVPWDGSAGSRTDAPAYLVCAHGRHDTCCAVRGRPVAAALAAIRRQQTWECSHTGGDRFAANLVVLPQGLYYGHVTPAVAPELVRAHDAGRLDPDLLRGRSCFSAPVQAAQHHARQATGETGLDALAPLTVDQLDPGTWRVHLEHAPSPLEVVVRAHASPPVARLTCAAGERLQTARVFELVSLA